MSEPTTPFTATVYPSTVTITHQGDIDSIGRFAITVANKGEDIDLTGIKIVFPEGDTEQDIIIPGKAARMEGKAAQEDTWNFTHSIEDDTYQALPKIAGSKVKFKKGDEFGFTLSKVFINNADGVGIARVVLVVDNVDLPPVELRVKKTFNKDSVLEFIVAPTTADPGTAIHITWGGTNIEKYIVTSSTEGKSVDTTFAGSDDWHPKINTTYTLDAKGPNGLELQTQRSVVIRNPTITKYMVTPVSVDEGGQVTITWETAMCDKVVFRSNNPDLRFNEAYPPAGSFPVPQEIKKATKIYMTAYLGSYHSLEELREVHMNPPVAESFEIEAQPLQRDKKITFKLKWKIKNATYQIWEEVAGEATKEVPIADKSVREWLVTPNFPLTTYKLVLAPLPPAKDPGEEDILPITY